MKHQKRFLERLKRSIADPENKDSQGQVNEKSFTQFFAQGQAMKSQNMSRKMKPKKVNRPSMKMRERIREDRMKKGAAFKDPNKQRRPSTSHHAASTSRSNKPSRPKKHKHKHSNSFPDRFKGP